MNEVLPEKFEQLKKECLNVSKNQLKAEHKTYFTWTAIFIIALIVSAIFITRGYIVNFAFPGYLAFVLIVFCIAFVAICIFNLIFSINDIDLSSYSADEARLAYYIVCGILVGITLFASLIGLAI